MKLNESVCLITGAARRLGRALALEFARRGARLAIHYNDSAQDAQDTAQECAELSGLGLSGAIALQADLADARAVDQLARATLERFGRVDILVNNASFFTPAPFLDATAEHWDAMWAINVRAPALLSRALAPGMIERGQGLILNLADAKTIASPQRRFVPYGVTKTALAGLTRGLAIELAPEVRVNAIAPGSILAPDDATDDLRQRFESNSILDRSGTPDDIVQAAVFLIEHAPFITGAILPVDGGAYL